VKLEVHGHACLKVVENGVGLIVDPWLIGSCYWRSWWHFPAVKVPVDQIVSGVRFIYPTHEHWDHLHYPSMRKFPRDVTVLVAKTPVPRLVDNARVLGFPNVVELPHGRPYRLAPGLEVTSYQLGPVNDTALVITNGRTTILDLNDCKMRGSPLRQIRRDHPKIDFLLMSHSNASGYPYCYTAEDPTEGSLRDRSDYIEEFCYIGEVLRPRYAIPFASNHCYLHKDTYEFNKYVNSPLDVQEKYAAYRIPASECVVMTSGDSWDENEGFKLGDQAELRDCEGTIERYRALHAEALEKTHVEEARATLSFSTFEGYFKRHIRQIPCLLRKLFPGIYVFEVPNDPQPYWVVDFGKAAVYRLESEPDVYHVKYQIPVALLKDCVRRNMWATFAPGKRYRGYIRRGALRYRFFFFVTIDLVSNGFFPLRNLLTSRALRVLFARRRELYLYLAVLSRLMFWGGADSRLKALYPRRLDKVRRTGTF